MPKPRPLPAQFATGPFSLDEARRAGVTVSRLRGRDLSSPFRGVRIVVNDGEFITAARAYATRMPSGQVFTHLSAARLLELRMPEKRFSSTLDVGGIHPDRAPKSQRIRGHELLARTKIVTLRSGMRVTSPIDTWIALASMLPLDDLVVMGDGLVSRKNPRATMELLSTAVDQARRRPGIAKLRAALVLIRPRTDSARETMLRLIIVRAGLAEPEVNGEIRDSHGRFVAFGDLFFRFYRVLVEYDGGGHFEQRQFDRDIDRLDDIMALDIRVIRVNKALMRTPDRVIAKITEALAARGPAPKRS